MGVGLDVGVTAGVAVAAGVDVIVGIGSGVAEGWGVGAATPRTSVTCSGGRVNQYIPPPNTARSKTARPDIPALRIRLLSERRKWE